MGKPYTKLRTDGKPNHYAMTDDEASEAEYFMLQHLYVFKQDRKNTKYQTLENQYQFIPCESIFDASKVPFLFSEETLLKKLDEKSIEIDQLLTQSKNN